MHAVVSSVASSRLVSSFVCSSRSLLLSVTHPSSLIQSQTIGLQSLAVQWFCKSVLASSAWSSSKPSPARGVARGVVRDDIEGIPVGEYGERYLVPNHMEEDENGLGEVRVECDSNGCIVVVPESRSLADEENCGRYLRCDLTGCYFTLEAPAVKSFEVIEGDGWRLGYETAPDSEGSFCAIVGAGGWSIAMTGGEFDDFCTLIQAGLPKLVNYRGFYLDCAGMEGHFGISGLDEPIRASVRKGILAMDEDSMTGCDDVALQVEKGTLWMQGTLPKTRVGALQLLWQPGVPDSLTDPTLKQAFEVRFILSGGDSKRQAEGYWPSQAVFDMLRKIDSFSFNQCGVSFTDNLPRRTAAKD